MGLNFKQTIQFNCYARIKTEEKEPNAHALNEHCNYEIKIPFGRMC